uniref:Kinase n=1 Tax=Trepomonas sp. PC1 TaxID=1076344 RepID=A0A146K3C8_9EUKA|eukprot:JAP91197.1 Kinase [Trepomonas sp. PC1]
MTKRIIDNKHVVIKLIPNKTDEIPKELAILQKLEPHEHVVSYFGYFKHECYMAAVMEYIPGISVAEFVYNIQKQALSSKRSRQKYFYTVKNISKQCLEALAHLHKQNILHRDIQPSNIMICQNQNAPESERYQIKFIDFGFSKISDYANTSIGTLHFAAPEILLQQEYGQRSDVFSLGAVIYYMLTGHAPFSSKTGVQARINCFNDQVEQLFDLGDDFFNNMLKQMMSSQIDQRMKCQDLLTLFQ